MADDTTERPPAPPPPPFIPPRVAREQGVRRAVTAREYSMFELTGMSDDLRFAVAEQQAEQHRGAVRGSPYTLPGAPRIDHPQNGRIASLPDEDDARASLANAEQWLALAEKAYQEAKTAADELAAEESKRRTTLAAVEAEIARLATAHKATLEVEKRAFLDGKEPGAIVARAREALEREERKHKVLSDDLVRFLAEKAEPARRIQQERWAAVVVGRFQVARFKFYVAAAPMVRELKSLAPLIADVDAAEHACGPAIGSGAVPEVRRLRSQLVDALDPITDIHDRYSSRKGDPR